MRPIFERFEAWKHQIKRAFRLGTHGFCAWKWLFYQMVQTTHCVFCIWDDFPIHRQIEFWWSNYRTLKRGKWIKIFRTEGELVAKMGKTQNGGGGFTFVCFTTLCGPAKKHYDVIGKMVMQKVIRTHRLENGNSKNRLTSHLRESHS